MIESTGKRMKSFSFCSVAFLIVWSLAAGCGDGGESPGGSPYDTYQTGYYDFDGDGHNDYVLESSTQASVMRRTGDVSQEAPAGYELAFYQKQPEKRLLAVSEHPFELWVSVDKNHTVRSQATIAHATLSGVRLSGASSLELGDGTVSSTEITITPEGGDCFCIRLSTDVKKAGSGEGLHQRMSYATVPPGEQWEDVDYVLPGFWYRHNTHTTPTAPSEHLSHTWVVREDRIAYPEVILHNSRKAYSLTLLRKGSAQRDPAPRASGRPFKGNIVYYSADGETDISGLGFSDLGDRQSLVLDYPFSEEAYSYQTKAFLSGIPDPTDPVYGFLENRDGQRLEHTWIIRMGSDLTLQDALRRGWGTAYSLFKPAPVPMACSEGDIRRSLAAYFRNSFLYTGHPESVAGFYTFLNHKGGPVLKVFDVAFLGMCILHAKHFLDYSREEGDVQGVQDALAVLDTWCSHGTKNGFFYDGWQLLFHPLDLQGGPMNFTPPFFGLEYVSTRRQAEALWSLTLAEQAEAERGFSHSQWSDTIIQGVRRLIAIQAEDGSYARTYHMETSEPVDPNPGGTASVVLPLTAAYKAYGNEQALASATRAGDYIIQHFIDPLDYYGSTLDSKAEDKEAALYALFAMRALYDAAPSQRWLEAAVKAAEASLSWYLLIDIPFSDNAIQQQVFSRIGLKTTGFSTVSAENNHIDVYVFGLPGSLWWLADVTGREEFREMARLILRNLMQAVPCQGNDNGINVEGLVPEVFQQTWWDFGFLGKGFYHPLSSQWTIASLWYAIDDLRRFTGKPMEEYGCDH